MSMDITFDEAMVEEVAARFDLRTPNRDALAALVRALEAGDGFQEVVADLATGVGKTFLMAALIDYLALQGGRDFLIVTPGSTIQAKTLENFDRASAKYVAGAETNPVIITPDNFQTGAVSAALRDPRRVKVFVFNVHLLLSPTAKVSRRTRNEDENLGGALYEYLENTPDLVVIADEHHVYRESAKKFSAAIRDLSPRAPVGLTATPDPADHSKVVFQYTLGEAIADGYVKVPVIVYRKNGTKDEQTQLRDACVLLERKEQTYAQYAAAVPGVTPVKPVLFVVCQDIEHAAEVGAVLARDGFIGDGSQVLEITSQSSDEALAALAAVEEPGSPIRAIVSVNMLREGWDVKNIAVIVALRRLASQTLTEQILGRGLRLPFKARTGVPMIDQVDLVAHDSYKALLDQKDVLRERIHDPERAAKTDRQGFAPAPTGVDPIEGGTAGDAPTDASTPNPATATSTSAPTPQAGISPRVSGDDVMPVEDRPLTTGGVQSGFFVENTDSDGNPAEVLAVADLEDRVNAPGSRKVNRVENAPQIVFPRHEARLRDAAFNLSDVPESDARNAGRDYTREAPATLVRDALTATRQGDAVEIKREVQESESVSPLLESFDVTRVSLVQAIMGQPEVPKERRSKNAADRLVNAFLEGAGVTDDQAAKGWSEARRLQAVAALARVIREHISNRPKVTDYEFVPVTLPVEPLTTSEDFADGHDTAAPFRKGYAYGGWRKNVMPVASFDAGTTEWTLARMLDRDPSVKWWLRLEANGDAYIQTERGRYFPDFIVLDKAGEHWLVEAKADKDVLDPTVVHKRERAEAWARAVQDEEEFGVWRYMFASESDLHLADGWESLLSITNKRR